MKTQGLSIALLLALCAAGCVVEDSPLISEGPLAGVFNGKPWAFVSGGTDLFSPDANKYLSSLRDVEGGACDEGGSGEVLVINIPFKPGTYELGQTALEVTFSSEESMRVATTGTLEVHEVTTEVIRAGLYAIHEDDADFEVSGQFTVHICDVK